METVQYKVKEIVEKMYEKMPTSELETINLYVNYKPEEKQIVKLETTRDRYTLLDTKELYVEGKKAKSVDWLEKEIVKRVEKLSTIEIVDVLKGLVELKKVSNRLFERNNTQIDSYSLQGKQVISKQDVQEIIKGLLETGVKHPEVFPNLKSLSTIHSLGKIVITEDNIITINGKAEGVMQLSRATYKDKTVWVMLVSIGENKETILLGEDKPEYSSSFIVEV